MIDKLSVILDSFDKRLSALEHSVNETLIGGLKNAAAEYQDEQDYARFSETYGPDLADLVEPSRILFGDDYDISKELWEQLKGSEGYGTEAFDEAAVIKQAVDDLKNKIAAIRGSAPEIEVKVEDAEDNDDVETELPSEEQLMKEFKEYNE